MKLYEIDEITVGSNVEGPKTKNAHLLMIQEGLQETDEKKSLAAAKKHLVNTFGQAKGQRIYAQADRMAVEADQLTEKLARAAENVSQEDMYVPEKNKDEKISPVANLTPPCNR